jgi:hypothetical protein
MNDDIPNFVYKGVEVKVLFVDKKEQYVRIADIKKLPDVLPFIFKSINKRYIHTFQGEEWMENSIFAGALYLFHPEIQSQMLVETAASIARKSAHKIVESGESGGLTEEQLYVGLKSIIEFTLKSSFEKDILDNDDEPSVGLE